MVHLIVDGRASPVMLRDQPRIFDLLNRLPGIIDMTKIAPPWVFPYHGVKPEDWGITGFVLITESHISIHTFVERGRFHMDIFSCKEFDTDQALNYVIEHLHVEKEKVTILRRE